MRTTKGDLLAMALHGDFDVVVHGCNCHCRMKRGIAQTIHNLFPEAYEADCKTEPGDRGKLGTFSSAEIKRGDAVFTIVNAYTQFNWDSEGVLADYDAIRRAMREVKRRFSGKRIAYPKIGAGLAGGDWKVISAIIDEELTGEDHTYVEFAPPTTPQGT